MIQFKLERDLDAACQDVRDKIGSVLDQLPEGTKPPLVQKFTYIIPLRYFITITRGIFLKGAGWAELKGEASILLVYGVVILTLASLTFRKQIR